MSPGEILGRDEELKAIDAFLADGPSPAAALVLEGEPGIGKTTLWLQATERAAALSYTVLAARPAESDEQLSFAGVGDLLAGVLEEVLESLPPPQRCALEVALLLAESPEPPDRGTVAFAFLSALRALARRGPLLIAIDDVQWLDPPSAYQVRFAAQRLGEEPVRLLVARRSDGRGRVPLGLERAFPNRVAQLAVGPLSLGALHELLRARLGRTLPRPTLRQLHEGSAGNPFYALEMARALERRGGALPLAGPLPVPDDLEELLGDRLWTLPAETREALLVAALDSGTTPELLELTLGRPGELQPAIEARLIALEDGRIRFAHPLFAGAIQQLAGAEQVRRLHLRLSEHAAGAEERALHLALGSKAPDSRAASELAVAARAARSRGAPIAGAAFFEHALRLSPPESPERTRWELELAETCFQAGDTARAGALLTRLGEQLPPGRDRAEVLLLLAMLARSSGGAPASWLAYGEQALQEAAGDPALEAAVHCEVSWAALFVNDLERALEHARVAVQLGTTLDDPETGARVLDTLAYMEFTAGIPARPEVVERALTLERAARHVFVELSPSLGSGFMMSCTGEFEAARRHLANAERMARERGDESGLAVVYGTLATLETAAGEWERAAAYARETLELAEHTGVNWHESLYASALLDAHLGRLDPALTAAQQLIADAEQGGSQLYLVRSLSILGFLELSLGNLAAARSALERACAAADALGIGEPGLLRCVPDYVETLVALGAGEKAANVLGRYEAQAVALGRVFAEASARRCRGLVLAAAGDLEAALAVLEEASAGHRGSSMPFELGRTLLCLGSVQRRAKQRRAARESLQEALAIFEHLGAPLWAEKARAGIGRIGGRTPVGQSLTASEERIASLVARGLTNREVAAELIVAVHTVEAALTRIYGKLGVRSRSELVRRFADSASR